MEARCRLALELRSGALLASSKWQGPGIAENFCDGSGFVCYLDWILTADLLLFRTESSVVDDFQIPDWVTQDVRVVHCVHILRFASNVDL